MLNIVERIQAVFFVSVNLLLPSSINESGLEVAVELMKR